MSQLLYVTCHPLTSNESKSLTVGNLFLKKWKELNPHSSCEELSLYDETVPIINKEIFSTWNKFKAGISFEELSESEQKEISPMNQFLNQFMAAKKIVFVNPMWNLFLPSLLKQYIDTLCIAGKTFQYTATGPKGLLSGKKVLHIQSAGGIYHPEQDIITDYGSAYLKGIMKFMGITDFSSIYIEGGDLMPDKAEEIVERACMEAVQIASKF